MVPSLGIQSIAVTAVEANRYFQGTVTGGKGMGSKGHTIFGEGGKGMGSKGMGGEGGSKGMGGGLFGKGMGGSGRKGETGQAGHNTGPG